MIRRGENEGPPGSGKGVIKEQLWEKKFCRVQMTPEWQLTLGGREPSEAVLAWLPVEPGYLHGRVDGACCRLGRGLGAPSRAPGAPHGLVLTTISSVGLGGSAWQHPAWRCPLGLSWALSAPLLSVGRGALLKGEGICATLLKL